MKKLLIKFSLLLFLISATTWQLRATNSPEPDTGLPDTQFVQQSHNLDFAHFNNEWQITYKIKADYLNPKVPIYTCRVYLVVNGTEYIGEGSSTKSAREACNNAYDEAYYWATHTHPK